MESTKELFKINDTLDFTPSTNECTACKRCKEDTDILLYPKCANAECPLKA